MTNPDAVDEANSNNQAWASRAGRFGILSSSGCVCLVTMMSRYRRVLIALCKLWKKRETFTGSYNIAYVFMVTQKISLHHVSWPVCSFLLADNDIGGGGGGDDKDTPRIVAFMILSLNIIIMVPVSFKTANLRNN